MVPRRHKCPCGPPNRRTLSRRDLGCPPCIAEDRRRLVDLIFITETVTYVYLKLPENSLSPARTSATAQRAQRTQLLDRAVRPMGGHQGGERRNKQVLSSLKIGISVFFGQAWRRWPRRQPRGSARSSRRPDGFRQSRLTLLRRFPSTVFAGMEKRGEICARARRASTNNMRVVWRYWLYSSGAVAGFT
jgi:hypothetical protein